MADLDGFSSVVHVTLQLHKQETRVCFPLPTQSVGTGQSSNLATVGQGYWDGAGHEGFLTWLGLDLLVSLLKTQVETDMHKKNGS